MDVLPYTGVLPHPTLSPASDACDFFGRYHPRMSGVAVADYPLYPGISL